jgi:hypothetical protein
MCYSVILEHGPETRGIHETRQFILCGPHIDIFLVVECDPCQRLSFLFKKPTAFFVSGRKGWESFAIPGW